MKKLIIEDSDGGCFEECTEIFLSKLKQLEKRDKNVIITINCTGSAVSCLSYLVQKNENQ